MDTALETIKTVGTLTEGQVKAITDARLWFESFPAYQKSHPIYRIFGYAGTGKTTVIKIISEVIKHKRIAYAAYTGKAAFVMQQKGIPATTIHHLIYSPINPNETECEKLFSEIEKETDSRKRNKLFNQLDKETDLKFRLNPKGLDGINLLVLDECSMVNGEMLHDLVSFKVPIIAFGDPGQLPPIQGQGIITLAEPDNLLTEIHRQAKENPIIDFSVRARNCHPIPYKTEGAAKCLVSHRISDEDLIDADQIITGKNNTRRHLNRRIRKYLGFNSRYPEVGDKLICLKNDSILINFECSRSFKDKETDDEYAPIFNGMTGTVTKIRNESADSIDLDIQFDVPGSILYGKPLQISVLKAYFNFYHDNEALRQIKWWQKIDHQEFDFGYAITVHKSQGSQWKKVIFWDDRFLSWKREERAKWLYTGITRASETLTVVIS